MKGLERRTLLLLALLLVPAAADARLGTIVAVGGGPRPAVALERFATAAECPKRPVVIVAVASELADTGDRMVAEMAQFGCAGVVLSQEQDTALAQLAAAGGVWFTGGDQRKITAALLGNPVGAAVVAAFERGVAIGGTSAGTACLSDPMITGDGDFTTIRAGAVQLAPGLGLFAGVVLDQHFHARQRQNRLLGVVLEHPALLGIGIDEATAVVRRPDGVLEVVGDGRVSVYDARAATVARQGPVGNESLGARHVQLHVLLPGELFDPRIAVAGPVESPSSDVPPGSP